MEWIARGSISGAVRVIVLASSVQNGYVEHTTSCLTDIGNATRAATLSCLITVHCQDTPCVQVQL